MSAAILFVSHGGLQKRRLFPREITVRAAIPDCWHTPSIGLAPGLPAVQNSTASAYALPLTFPWQMNRLTRSAVEQEVKL